MISTKRILKTTLAVLGVLVVLTMLLFVGGKWYLKTMYPLDYIDIVNQNATTFSLPPSLVLAVIHTESRFDSEAVSPVGAKGLMQLMDGTFEWIQQKLPGDPAPLSQVFEPAINIQSGCKVLDVLFGQFEHTETVLAAYNAGIGNVSSWLKNPDYSTDGETLTVIPFKETKNYIHRVLKAQKRYQTLYNIV
ncbi:MAG: lytic transglycosylase domain-containing protein [Clostridia bacterium]|nr:lytic transglycosylase domain-containing protein [Clostridia bacterium]